MIGGRMMDMFSKKEYIYEIYKEKSFSKAAKNLYISQPSLSASVKRIEERIKAPIFDRSTNPISLTECGVSYIQSIEKMKAIEEDFSNYMKDLQGLQTGTLSIGGTNLFSSYILPPLIAAFTKKYPYIKIDLIEESTAKLEKQVLDGELDIMIDNFAFDELLLDRCFYQSEHLLLVVPKRFEVTQNLREYQLTKKEIVSGEYLKEDRKAVSLELFKKVPFIFLKPENDTMKRSVKICKNHGLKPKVILNLDQQMTAYNVSCSGMGACFASDLLIRHGTPHPDVAYYKLADKECGRNVYFYHKKGRYLTSAMSAFLEHYI